MVFLIHTRTIEVTVLSLTSSVFLLRTAVPSTYCKMRYNFGSCGNVVKSKLVLHKDNGPNLLTRTENKGRVFLISNFRHVLNVIFFILGIPWCRNFICGSFETLCLVHLHRRCKQDESAYTAYEDGTDKMFRNVRI